MTLFEQYSLFIPAVLYAFSKVTFIINNNVFLKSVLNLKTNVM